MAAVSLVRYDETEVGSGFPVSKQSLLLVDGDSRSLRVLEVSLRKAGFTVTPASSVKDALEKLDVHVPDLIISETTFVEGDGFELRRRVRAMPTLADIPFIFLTAEAAIENKIRGLELGVDDYLTKPIYIKEIVTRINILLQKRQRLGFEEKKDGRTRFTGRVTDMPVVDVIQTIEISRKSGVIQFVGERGRQAAIYFRDGKVIDAEAGTLQGEDAVYRLLTWSEGEFEVVFRTVRRREVIMTSSQGLLMEGMRRLDEWSRLLEQLPPPTHRFEIDTGELAQRLGDVPDDNNRILRLIDGRRTLLEVIDASDVGDLECLQAISRLYFEELLHDLDHDLPLRRDTGNPMPLVEVPDRARDESTSGPHPRPGFPAARPLVPPPVVAEGPIERLSARDIVAEELVPAPAVDAPVELDAADALEDAPAEEAAPGPLLGGYRPSSLRLIDEAVAAAQAIDPSLFDDKPTSGPTAVPRPMADADSVPEAISDDQPAIPPRPPRRPATMPPPVPGSRPVVAPIERDDSSGLRMIGSLGRDRAEASGEVSFELAPPPPLPETQRELVTILPRRAGKDASANGSPSTPAGSPPRRSATMPPPPPPPRARRSSMDAATEAAAVEAYAARVSSNRTAAVFFALAAVLGVIALVLWLRRPARPRAQAQAQPPVQLDAGVVMAPAPDAIPAPIDAAVAITAPVDAPPIALAVTVDAGVAARPLDPIAQARALVIEARTAVQKNDAARGLEIVDRALVLHRTAAGYLLRAQALLELGRTNEALVAVSHAEVLAPRSPNVWYLRGSILWTARRWDDAHDAYNQFLELEQESPRAALVRRRLEEPH